SHFENELRDFVCSNEARALGRQVMAELTGRSMAKLLADNEACWTNNQQKRIDEILDALKNKEPLQYILGFADFMDLRFNVKPGVLIPRGETEELVSWVIDGLRDSGSEQGRWKGSGKVKEEDLRILDVGCGSGIIGITLAKEFPGAHVTCVDLHQLPLETTRENARMNKVDIEVLELDVLNPSPSWLKRSFDVIFSNPPYVMESQKASMQANVLRNEPESALFVPDEEALIFYQNICEYASHSLADGGSLYFEINDQLGNETKSLVQTYFRTVELKKDIHGKDRMIKAYDGH
ncbi:MAG: peptide chain release factor N(5)-glutamine methyltransferase, partial [Bacteroidales bacterium]|nr:peptide chain release factor N(5)-glutamine methyltransferase [Bacteroidales bacterium]